MTDDERQALKVGDRVRVRGDDGTEFDYTVKAAPWQLGHGEWVVGLRGITGEYLLSRVVGLANCAVCRHRETPPNRSVCLTCVPADEQEELARGRHAIAEMQNKLLREALTWAVGFIRCNLPKTAAEYPDMRNAESLLREQGELFTGEFTLQRFRAEQAEVERDRLRAALELIAAGPPDGRDAVEAAAGALRGET